MDAQKTAQDVYYSPIIGTQHRCIDCVRRIAIIAGPAGQTDNGFIRISDKYPHLSDCPHLGKF